MYCFPQDYARIFPVTRFPPLNVPDFSSDTIFYMPAARRTLATCIGGLACASLACALSPLDHLLFDAATHHRTGTQTVRWVTELGRMPVLASCGLILAALLSYRARNIQAICLIGIAAICTPAISHTIKNLVQRPRPPFEFAVPPYEPTWSFPSSHSANAVVIAGALAILVGRRWAHWVAFVFALMIGASRIYLGHHWASDVFAGWALGLALLVALRSFPNLRRRKSPS